MSAEVAVEGPMPSVLKSSRALWLILEAAELRGLPLPFSARAVDYQPEISLQFHTRDEVATWAEALGSADLEERLHLDDDGTQDQTVAQGEWLDVPIEVVCSIPRGRS